MVRFHGAVVAVVLGLLFPACGHDSPTNPSSNCTSVTLSGTNETFGPSGGSGSVYVGAAPARCGSGWSATSSASWLTVTPAREGSDRVTYQVAANPGATGERSGTLTIAGRSFIVTQVSSVTFNYTGSAQTWVVPRGVTVVDVDAYGAAGARPAETNWSAGGFVDDTGNGSPGGRVQTTVTVAPGQTLYVYVGGAGTSAAGGFNGGGGPGADWAHTGSGGGASDIRIGGTALENRVVVAGGGGGGGCFWSGCRPAPATGGAGGGTVAAASAYAGCIESTLAGGGSQSAGGAGGRCYDFAQGVGVYDSRGASGTLGAGGNGGEGRGLMGYDPGSGGGGGYYGGGGGAGNGAGGGGSSYSIGSNTIHTPGVRSGHGQIVITLK